ncbi:hypothetical protein A2803_00755 [Candidatus Woesebacteria bacterium RIFCSPHIGHO2_01_FULL_44_21]|uniref:Uncharacterized protein n=1 Tax=Candidatus Woesebacteria bacterium RIFCSPHIGHO2_01_FULL_44_21 TaxID=1802503 RepID=A0A1F7YXS7_9BACT|nr:MAG: hypothetical protein A2803_00755 [Candidatus Woesebacteria bacterium RIFCSPHIGHO2_01_FULL_44_21]OGM70391.1 MAG: hypothetical protein A2897_01185 [Candidatus Woesebacteria bacterium RIFCSPLOWO2_01_FULL_44_24b]
MGHENLESLIRLTAEYHRDAAEQRLDAVPGLLSNRQNNPDAISEAIQILEGVELAQGNAEVLIAILPNFIELFEQARVEDIPIEVIRQMADEIRVDQRITTQTDTEENNGLVSKLIKEYPDILAAFEDDDNWVEKKEGLLIKRSAINPFVVRTDGREIAGEIDRNNRTMAIGNFYKVWLGSIPEEERPTQKYSRIPLLTKEQMADFTLFIAKPPEMPGVPKSYTIQKKTVS